MSNPWSCSSTEVAFSHFKDFLELVKSKGIRQSSNEQNHYAYSADNNSNINDSSDESLQQTYSNSLVARLREADTLAEVVNEQRYRKQLDSIYNNSSATNTSINELSELLRKMAEDFRYFDCDNALKMSYLQTVRANSLVWDDLSAENNRKLVMCIRSAIELIRKLHKTNTKSLISIQKSHETNSLFEEITPDISTLEALVSSTRIFSDKEEFPIELLFAMLEECTDKLAAIRSFNERLDHVQLYH